MMMSIIPEPDREYCPGKDITLCLEISDSSLTKDENRVRIAQEILSSTLSVNDNLNTFCRCTIIVSCLKIIHDAGEIDELIQAVEETAECYRNSPVFYKMVFLERLRTCNLFLIQTLFVSRFHAMDDSFPRHLLFDNTFTYKKLFKICNFHLMGFGENTHYNIGVPTKGATKHAHQINFRNTEIMKVSMSNQHTLFLDANNQVFGCGSTSKGQLGFISGTIAVTPSRIELPHLKDEIVIDIVAMEGFSLFLTQRSLYVCGDYKKIIPDSNGSEIKKFVLFENIDCFDMTITVNTDFICIYALKLVFLCGFLSDEYAPPFMKYSRDTFINQNFDFIKNKGYKRSDSFNQNIFDSKNIDHTHEALPSFETSSGNHRRVSLQYARGQRYEFLFCIMSPLLYEYDKSLTQHRSFEIYLRSGEIVPYVFLLDGLRVYLNIWQFEVSKEGEIILLAQTYKLQKENTNGSMGSCLYRGKFKLKRKRRCDQDFVYAPPKNDVEVQMRKSYWEISLEEIPNTHGATFLSASPDLKNVIYKVEADQSFNEDDWGQLKWRTMDFDFLQKRQNETADEIHDEPHDIIKVLSKDGPSFSTTVELIGFRCPVFLPFVKNGVLDFSEAAKVLELTEESNAVNRFLAGYPFSESYYEKLRRNVSVRPGPLVKVISQVGISVRKQGQNSMRLCKTDNVANTIIKDCTLISSDGVRFSSNQKWLKLHSRYISLALCYSLELTLILDYPATIIERVLNFLEKPELLLDSAFDEIYQIFGFCDQYMFEALMEDSLQALFLRATHTHCEELFNIYFSLPTFHDLIVDLFIVRLDILCFYSNSALAPLELLREIGAKVTSIAKPNTALNPLSLYQNFTNKEDSCSVVIVADDTLRKSMKGSTKNQRIKKEVDEIIECVETTGFLEFSMRDTLESYEFDGYYSEHHVKIAFQEKFTRAQQKILETKAKSKDKKKKKDSQKKGLPIEPPASRPFPEPRAPLESILQLPLGSKPVNCSSETVLAPLEVSSTSITENEENVDSLNLSDLCINPEEQTEAKITQHAVEHVKSPFLESVEKVPKPKLKPIGKGHKANYLLEAKVSADAPWGSPSSPGPSTSFAAIQAEEQEKQKQSVPEVVYEKRPKRQIWNSESEETAHNLSFSEIMHEEKQKTEDEKKKFSRPLAFIEEEEKAAKELQQLYEQNVGDEMLVSVDFEKDQQKDPVWVSSISRRF